MWRDVAFTSLTKSVRRWLSAAFAFVRQPVTIAMMVSASFLLVALTAAAHLRVQHVESSAAPSCSRGRIVAHISGMHEAKWRYPATAPDPMLGITAETTLDLAGGLLELAFTSGAKVIIEGPALVVVNDPTGMQVDVGGVSVRYDRTPGANDDPAHTKSPRQAEIKPPFIVRTPWAVVRDLGTEFGVAVSKNGPTEVHVFQGLVELDHPEPHGNAGRVRLGPGDNAQMDGRGAVRLGVAGRAGRIVRRLPKARVEDEPPDWIEAEAEVICLDRFEGKGPLAAASPQDRGGHGIKPWNVTGADWALADGELKAGNGMAMIPFVPESGAVYRLAVDMQVSSGDWRWGALGFLNDPSTESFASHPGGYAWMGQRGQRDPERGGNFAFGGPGMLARLASIDDLYGRHNRMVQLDTRGNRWKAKFYANGKEVAWFVFGSTYPPITFISLEACAGAAVTFDNFRLAVYRPKSNATKR